MDRVHTLLDTIIRLQRRSQTEVCAEAGVHPSNLSKYLSGETDIRSSSLRQILKSLGISLETILEDQIDILIGKKRSESVGQALEVLLSKADPMTARTLLDTLSKRSVPKNDPAAAQALSVVNGYRAKFKSVRKS